MKGRRRPGVRRAVPHFNWNRETEEARYSSSLPQSKADSILSYGLPSAALLLLGPLPTRDNMQTRRDVLARESTRCGIGGGVYLRIAWLANIEVCFTRGSRESGPLLTPHESTAPTFLPVPKSPKVGATIPARNCDFIISARGYCFRSPCICFSRSSSGSTRRLSLQLNARVSAASS